MDKEALFARRIPEGDVEVPGIGTVRVRGLSRAEALAVQAADGEARDRKLIAFGMVDPPLTEAEAGKWQRAATAVELEPVTDKIVELSGLATPDKERYVSFRDESGSGVHTLPGTEAGDDGGSTPGGNEQ